MSLNNARYTVSSDTVRNTVTGYLVERKRFEICMYETKIPEWGFLRYVFLMYSYFMFWLNK